MPRRTARRTALLAGLALALTACTGGEPSATPSPDPTYPADTRFLSVLVGRGTAFEAEGCRIAPGAVDVREVAQWSYEHGVRLSPNLVPAYLATGDRYCQGSRKEIGYLTLAEAKALTKTYAARPITSGSAYRVLTTLTHDQQVQEVCGAKDTLAKDGFPSVTGMFAPATAAAQGEVTDQIVDDVIRPCGFLMVRDYGARTWKYQPKRADGSRIKVTVRTDQDPAGYHRVVSINGGSCPAAWTCGDGGDRPYTSPDDLVRDLADAPPGSHMMVQFYRLVSGDVPGKWTCDGPVAQHATYAAEVYCYDDYQAFVQSVPPDVVVTDPRTVAHSWAAVPATPTATPTG